MTILQLVFKGRAVAAINFCHLIFILYVLRLVADGWLELKFTSPELGQSVLSDIQTLRSTWSLLLEKKLSLYHSKLFITVLHHFLCIYFH